MKTLFVLRHAKSSWSDLTLNDHERPLNSRGRAGAKLLGQYLAKTSVPELLLSSTSVRTRETWHIASAEIAEDERPEIIFTSEIYHGDPESLLRIVLAHTQVCDSIGLLGHNMGVSDFILQLVKSDLFEETAQRIGKFPTAAMARLEFKNKIGWGKATLVDYVTPKKITQNALV